MVDHHISLFLTRLNCYKLRYRLVHRIPKVFFFISPDRAQAAVRLTLQSLSRCRHWTSLWRHRTFATFATFAPQPEWRFPLSWWTRKKSACLSERHDHWSRMSFYPHMFNHWHRGLTIIDNFFSLSFYPHHFPLRVLYSFHRNVNPVAGSDHWCSPAQSWVTANVSPWSKKNHQLEVIWFINPQVGHFALIFILSFVVLSMFMNSQSPYSIIVTGYSTIVIGYTIIYPSW